MSKRRRASEVSDIEGLTMELNALSLLAAFCGFAVSWMVTSDIFKDADDRGLKLLMLNARAAANNVLNDYEERLRPLIAGEACCQTEREDKGYER